MLPIGSSLVSIIAELMVRMLQTKLSSDSGSKQNLYKSTYCLYIAIQTIRGYIFISRETDNQ